MPVELRRRAQTYEYAQYWNYKLSLSLIAWLVSHFLEIGQDTALGAIVVARHVSIVVDLRKVGSDDLLRQLDEVGDALSVQDGAMELNELSAVLDHLDDLFDLFEATAIIVFHEGDEKLEQILRHFVFNDGLASYFLLLYGQLVQDSQTQAKRQPYATDFVQLISFIFEEKGAFGRKAVLLGAMTSRDSKLFLLTFDIIITKISHMLFGIGILIVELRNFYVEGLVLDLNDALELEDVLQQKVDQTDGGQ
jgi:hypothetical protein